MTPLDGPGAGRNGDVPKPQSAYDTPPGFSLDENAVQVVLTFGKHKDKMGLVGIGVTEPIASVHVLNLLMLAYNSMHARMKAEAEDQAKRIVVAKPQDVPPAPSEGRPKP